MSRDFEIGRNVSSEESTVGANLCAITTGWLLLL